MRIVIVGAGPAGVTVAETVRQYDPQAEIVMCSGEPFPPYSPPAMLEYFSTGREVHFWKGKDVAERLGVDYRPATTVSAIAPDRKQVHLDDGESLTYDRAVLAMGARLYAPLAGEDKPGVYNFKSLSAASELMTRVREGHVRSIIVVGAGFVGVEIALLLADLGLEVTQLVRSRVMRGMLDPETSELVLAMMRERRIDVRLGADADAVAFVGKERAEAVETKAGDTVTADLMIAATGLKPNIDCLEGSDIQTDWGVVVDDHLRTNVPDVYAAGDVAATSNRITGQRSVHANFPNAVAQGRTAAYNLMGWDLPYEGADSMNSLKHLGLPVIAAGQMEGEELRVRRGSNLRKLYLQDDRIVGFRLFGDVSAAGIFRSLMNRHANVSAFRDLLLDARFGMGYVEKVAEGTLQRPPG